MYLNNKLLIGKNDKNEAYILPSMANRHGLITGASGSGKTTTVKVLVESFSASGVPSFVVDVKGDVASICMEGEINNNVESRIKDLKLNDFKYQKFPVTFFDVFSKSGHPIRTTISNINPSLLAIMLGLSDAQEGNLAIVFQIAKDENMKLNDLGDLKSILSYVNDNKDNYIDTYGKALVDGLDNSITKPTYFTGDGIYKLIEHFYSELNLSSSNFVSSFYNGVPTINNLDCIQTSLTYFPVLETLNVKGNDDLSAFLSSTSLSSFYSKLTLNNTLLKSLTMKYVANDYVDFDIGSTKNLKDLTYLDFSYNQGVHNH